LVYCRREHKPHHGFSEAEQAQLVALLGHLIVNLDKMTDTDASGRR
jgi:hypothetical protein